MNALNEIKALNCSNKAQVMMAHQTYIELTTVERYTDVTCHYDKELDIIYFEGEKDGVKSTFVSVHHSFTLTLTWLRTVQEKLCHDQENSFILVIRDADSSSVRYKLSEGLTMPPSISNRLLRKGGEKSKKRKLCDNTTTVASGEFAEPSTSKTESV